MKKLALLLSLLLAACAPPPLAPEPEVPLSKRGVVLFRVGATGAKRLRLLELVDLAERAFLAEAGGLTPPVRSLTLWPKSAVPRRLHKGELQGKYAGLCRRNLLGAEIHIATGRRSPMAALPHELLHARIGDPDHESPLFRRLDRVGRALALLPLVKGL